MKTNVNKDQFRQAFYQQRPDNFTNKGLWILFDYFEELESDLGEEIELDVIAICCDYTESTLEEFNTDYNQSFESLEDASEYVLENGSLVGLTDNTLVYAYL